MAEETCLRVQTLARELGYQPRPLLASLASRRFKSASRTRGEPMLYLTYTSDRTLFEGNTRYVLGALKPMAEPLGYRLIHRNLESEEATRGILDKHWKQGGQGVILGEGVPNHLPVEAGWERFAIITCRTTPLPFPCTSVEVDHFSHLYDAWNRLGALGHQRIGAVLPMHRTPVFDDQVRFAAFRQLTHALPPEHCPVCVFTPDFNRDLFLAWYERTRPEAIIGFQLEPYYAFLEMY